MEVSPNNWVFGFAEQPWLYPLLCRSSRQPPANGMAIRDSLTMIHLEIDPDTLRLKKGLWAHGISKLNHPIQEGGSSRLNLRKTVRKIGHITFHVRNAGYPWPCSPPGRKGFSSELLKATAALYFDHHLLPMSLHSAICRLT